MGPGEDQDDGGVKDESHGEQERHDRPINRLHQVQGPQPGAGVDGVTMTRPQAITVNIHGEKKILQDQTRGR